MYTTANSQQSDNWVWQNPKPQGNTLSSVDFVNNNTGYSAGSFGTIIKTTDKGENWDKLNSGTELNFGCIDFADANTGYAGGEEQLLKKTTNAGLTWNDLTLPPAEHFYIYDIDFINASTGYVLGFFIFESIIWKTTDGGQSWTAQTTGGANYLFNLYFIDENFGFAGGGALGGEIVKTTNGGQNWTLVFQGNPTVYSFHFFDNLNGIAGCGNGRVFMTTNGGDSWTFRISDGGIDIRSMNFLDANTGFGFGSGSVYVKTTDGGNNWLQSETIGETPSSQYFDADMTEDGSIFAVGSFGAMVRSTNSGETFDFPASVTDGYISDIEFLNVSTGYAVAGFNKGDILKTTNGGQDWVSQITEYIPPVYGISFTDDNTGYLAGSVTVYKTTNAGTNWTISYASTQNEIFTDVYFTTANTGYVTGSYGRLLKTTNAGNNWTPMTIPSSGTILTSITFTDENTGYTVGDDNSALKTTDGGSTWNPMSITTPFNDLGSITFSDDNTGYVSASNGIYKTTNAGTSWNLLPAPAGGYNDVQFRGNFGYAVAGGGKIVKSTDAGSSWITQPTVTQNSLYAVYFNIDNYVYTGGIKGTILKTIPTELIITSTGNNNYTSVPTDFNLSQNYPNPFNPTTVINYSVTDQATNVKLVVFNSLGMEVSTLVNQKQNAGNYSVNFNGSNFPSGMYFYKLSSNGVSITKKMLLVK
ncbi:MAG: YCF48-related protein [bacterium]